MTRIAGLGPKANEVAQNILSHNKRIDGPTVRKLIDAIESDGGLAEAGESYEDVFDALGKAADKNGSYIGRRTLYALTLNVNHQKFLVDHSMGSPGRRIAAMYTSFLQDYGYTPDEAMAALQKVGPPSRAPYNVPLPPLVKEAVIKKGIEEGVHSQILEIARHYEGAVHDDTQGFYFSPKLNEAYEALVAQAPEDDPNLSGIVEILVKHYNK